MLDRANNNHDDINLPRVNAMSVDVEDYFHVSAFEAQVDRDDWSRYECRIPANMDRILELFETTGTRATFFVLGWVAERYPALLQQVAALGHEIASHGFNHTQVGDQSENEFRQDVDRTRKLLQDVTGQPIHGYRAASFSISADNPWAHEVLARTGHLYSSSFYPIRHDRYGAREQPRFAYKAGEHGLLELPVTAFEWAGMRLPCGGGGYFRLLPYAWTKWGLGRVNRRDRQPGNFYFHPWELDPDQPRMAGADSLSRFRHYVNLAGVQVKLRKLLCDFRWSPIADVFADLLERESQSGLDPSNERSRTAV